MDLCVFANDRDWQPRRKRENKVEKNSVTANVAELDRWLTSECLPNGSSDCRHNSDRLQTREEE